MDLFDELTWNIPQVIAWVLLRDRDHVRWLANDAKYFGPSSAEDRYVYSPDTDNDGSISYWPVSKEVNIRANRPDEDSLNRDAADRRYPFAQSCADAEQQIRKALLDGDLIGYGVPNGEGDAIRIPAEKWQDLIFHGPPFPHELVPSKFQTSTLANIDPGAKPIRPVRPGELKNVPPYAAPKDYHRRSETTAYEHVRFSRGDVLRLWPPVPDQEVEADEGTERQLPIDKELLLQNRIKSVVAAAKQKWNEPTERPSYRDMAEILYNTHGETLGFKRDTIRQILEGRYGPMKRRGIAGLDG